MPTGATRTATSPTQEAAAELLALPFSPSRRHLTEGVAHVVDALWERELFGWADGAAT